MYMKRTFKLNGEVTPEANDMLVAYCKKHERSKGFLLEKMIRKFCVEPDKGCDAPEQTKQQKAIAEYVKPKAPSKRFVPPTFQEVDAYMIERGVNDNAEAKSFCDFYESKGWVVGKAKMKSWKAAVRNWLKNYKAKSTGKDILQLSAESNWEEGINEIF